MKASPHRIKLYADALVYLICGQQAFMHLLSIHHNISKQASVVYVTILALARYSCTRLRLSFAKSTGLLLLRSHICGAFTLSTTVSGAEPRYVRQIHHTVGDPQK